MEPSLLPNLFLLMGVLLCGQPTCGLIVWEQLPYNDDSFNTKAKFDTNVTLYCNDSSLTSGFKFNFWIRPDTTVMKAKAAEEFKILDGWAGWEVSDDGMEMRVFTLQERQFGIYHCVGEEQGETKVTKRGLNYNGAYFGDLWPEYRMNTIIGLSSAGGFLVMVMVIYLTYTFRYKEDDDGGHEEGIEERSSVGEHDEPLPTVSTADLYNGVGYVNDKVGHVYDVAHVNKGFQHDEKWSNVGEHDEGIEQIIGRGESRIYDEPLPTMSTADVYNGVGYVSDEVGHVYDVAYVNKGFSLQTTEL